jgi:hypothetical protein
VHAEMEKPRLVLVSRSLLTIVVLPEPEGAEKIISLPFCILANLINAFHEINR